MLNASQSAFAPSPLWRRLGMINLVAVFAMAAIYLGLQWSLQSGFDDPWFVGAILANAVTTYRVGLFIQPRIARLFDPLDGGSEGQAAIKAVFDDRWTIAFSLFYGALLGGGVALIAPWDDPALNMSLIAFVFAGNLIIGQALWAIVMYWRLSRKLIARMDISILRLSHHRVVLLQDIAIIITLAAAVIAVLAVTSVLLSKLVFDPIVLLFSICTFLVVTAAYAITIAPLATRLRDLKNAELSRLDTLIAGHHKNALGETRGQDSAGDLDTLLTLRDRVSAVRCFPPNAEFSLATIASVAFVSFLPALVDYVISLITK